MRIASPLLRLPAAFTELHQVLPEEIDEYNHVNNTVYLQWMDRIAWAHSAALGLSLDHCLELRRGMAVRHTRVDYLRAALEGDDLLIATWIVDGDGRLRCTRRFDMLRVVDGERVLEAEIDFFCMNLDSGKPARFPPAFTERYRPLPEVTAAYAALPASSRQLGQWRT
jgi:acyl-CoA thioester hydrolase